MSYANLAQVLPTSNTQDITKIVTAVLRLEYKDKNSALKRISRKFDIKQRTAKNWYEGVSAPNLRHFVKLVSASPRMLACFLILCGYEEMAQQLSLNHQENQTDMREGKAMFYSVIFDTNQASLNASALRTLNQRQLWFYSEVDSGDKPNAKNLCDHWLVSLSTARRDIALLTRLKLVGFIGSKRSGFYISRSP